MNDRGGKSFYMIEFMHAMRIQESNDNHLSPRIPGKREIEERVVEKKVSSFTLTK